jgi:hypothetical protein
MADNLDRWPDQTATAHRLPDPELRDPTMVKFEVETDIVISCRVKLLVDAENKAAALDVAARLLPADADPESSRRWQAKVELRAPKGVNLTSCRAYHFQQATGDDKARLAK